MMKKLSFCILFFAVGLLFFRLGAADLEKTEIRVTSHSVFAETEYKLTLFTWLKEDMFEGQVTLPHGAIVMEYDKDMTVELMSGDTFRITAPVSAPRRTVTFRCVWIQNQRPAQDDTRIQSSYSLPLADFNKTPFTVQIQARGAADLPDGGKNCVFRKEGDICTASMDSENGPLPDRLDIRYLLPGGKLTVMEKMPDGRTAFMIAGRTETVIPQDELTKRIFVSPIIVWDASEKAEANHKTNIAYLQKLLARLDAANRDKHSKQKASGNRASSSRGEDQPTKQSSSRKPEAVQEIKTTIQPRLVVFRDKPDALQDFDSPEDLIEFLTEKTKLSGKANPQAVMNEILKNKAGNVFFFANSGATAQADLNFNYGTLKIHTFVPGPRQNYFFLPDLSALTGGELILTDTETPEKAANQLLIPNLRLKSYKINGMEEEKGKNTVFCISYNIFFLILGTLPGSGEHSLDLTFEAGSNTFSMSTMLKSDDALPTGPFNQVFQLLRVFNQREGLELNHSRVKRPETKSEQSKETKPDQSEVKENGKNADAKEIRP